MKKKVVVTGMGVISPIGLNVGDFWHGLTHGVSGVDVIQGFDATGYPTTFGAEVKGFHIEDFVTGKEKNRMDTFTQYGVAAAKEALEQADINTEDVDPYRMGIIVGSSAGGTNLFVDNYKKLQERGPRRVSPYLTSSMLIDATASEIAMMTGAKGKSGAFVTACATGNNCVGEGMRAIQWNEADVMIVGGSEGDFSELDLAAFSRIKALSTRNDDPKKASRPFDKDRDGFVLGCGGGILVLESEEHALQRGANILARVSGYGTTSDAYHYTSPDPSCSGMIMAMKLAIEDAGIGPADIDYINAHGTSTKLNDHYETIAIKKLFGTYAKDVPVSSIKSMTGHLIGGAGAVELIASICALRHGVIPPTINFVEAEPEMDLNYVPNEAQAHQVDTVLTNSFGFGGHNATLVVRKWEG
ncbi:beta-ketoacyl-[acyl-carrier-protein] synthase II [Peribacillus simplex]|uniref:beta-ketoacyl-ACP synthase II n=1 Tax=Peribacillus TaxID=2675229 RepID=UPI000F630BD1|nr:MULTISPECIES: beta-ketoacyl-ACP synthase II [Peribacillus]MDF1999860.1 beta-ketoacyl-ACP synthase II [Peribacillus frigoritolerans]RRN69523.1 beta-ketoacyl-[acyl-carrier-protein] synthase II [Peribacillus simplex]